MATPYMLRWLNAVMDNRKLSSRAKVAAVPIFRHSNMKDGFNCFVGIKTASDEMSVSPATMKRGFRELANAQYLKISDLPAFRRHRQGAYRRAIFPTTGDIHGSDAGVHEDTNQGHSDLQVTQYITNTSSGPGGPPEPSNMDGSKKLARHKKGRHPSQRNPAREGEVCPEGHEMFEGDYFCSTCAENKYWGAGGPCGKHPHHRTYMKKSRLTCQQCQEEEPSNN